MGTKRFLYITGLFAVIFALGAVGGSWETAQAQGTVPPNPPPPPPAAALINSIITAGEGHTCAITPADGLRCWGWNDSGQLGDRTFTDSTEPVYVEDIIPSSITDLTAGIKHTCALTSNSEVYCWGLNESGQLGNGSNANSNIPVLVQGLPKNIVAIDAGALFTCAEGANGNVYCWGDNSLGQLNNGTSSDSNVAVLADPKIIGNVVMVNGGLSELQGVTVTGETSVWNSQPIVPVTGLPNEDYAILTAGRWVMGGCSTTIGQVVNCWGSISNPLVSGAELDRHLLDSGLGHACTVNTSGLVCWGRNSNGQLGNGTDLNSDTAVVVKNIPSIVDLATGMDHSCAIIDDEIIKCWGLNNYGQLGNGTKNDAPVPQVVK